MYQPDVVIKHANCDDGWMAQLVVEHYLVRNNLKEVVYLDGDYANVDIEYWQEKCRGKNVLVVDFSFKQPVKGAIEAACKSMLILDHHATAKEVLKNETFEDVTLENCEKLLEENKIVALFDMERCGSRLAWEFFFPDQDLPRLLEYVDYQDRAVKGIARAQNFTYWLRSHPELYRTPDKHEFIYELDDDDVFEEALDNGAVVAAYHNVITGDLSETIRKAELVHGDEVVRIGYTIGSYALASSAANVIAGFDDIDVGLVFYQSQNKDRPYGISLRSRGTGKAKDLAEKLGGGGHPDAAGVNMTVTEFLTLLASFNTDDEDNSDESED